MLVLLGYLREVNDITFLALGHLNSFMQSWTSGKICPQGHLAVSLVFSRRKEPEGRASYSRFGFPSGIPVAWRMGLSSLLPTSHLHFRAIMELRGGTCWSSFQTLASSQHMAWAFNFCALLQTFSPLSSNYNWEAGRRQSLWSEANRSKGAEDLPWFSCLRTLGTVQTIPLSRGQL